MKNHERVFRPLRGGVMIYNRRLGEPGRGIDSLRRMARGLPLLEALRLEPVTVSAAAARGSMNP